MKNKKIMIIILLISIIIICMFFIKNNYRFSKNGNNISNKSADEIKEYILNIDSYRAIATITIKSNKNENRYKVEQKYNKENNVYKQQILEPDNIKGVEFAYDGKNLTLKNTNLNIKKIYQDYAEICSNILSLSQFIKDFKNDNNSKCYSEKNMVIMETTDEKNPYNQKKKLYINKTKGTLEKLEIIDKSQNVRIYILYNEIEINLTPKE